jgi:phenylacetate-CoA ligase
MKRYFDDLETRSADQRESDLLSALPGQIAHAKAKSAYFAQLLQNVEPRDIDSRRALAGLPVTRKAQLVERQKRQLPFGGLTTVACGELARIFASPGPIYEPEARRADYWRAARALFAAGFRKGDVIHNSFSYHLTPAGSVFETGAHELGCAVVPGGVGQTELQLRAIADIKPNGYVGTPSFLRILLDKAAEAAIDVSCLVKALVSAEAAEGWGSYRQVLEHALALLGQGRCLVGMGGPQGENVLRVAHERLKALGARPSAAEAAELLNKHRPARPEG